MENRRLSAGEELQQFEPELDYGYRVKIAKKYGVSQATVTRWDQTLRREGVAALLSTKAKGQPPRLTSQQKQQLMRMLAQGAPRHGYETDVWTGKRVAALIRKEFGIEYSWKYIPELLRDQFGFSWQKPDRRPHELDPEKVRKWLRYSWTPAKKGR